ncbi:MFS transporter [Streptomyces sp. NPDC093097]|uniref:MFS transporter n=1 Tax=Streptomyces sp. NPDC093097 TaxID=3366027 RepID=UPI003801F264
MAGPSPAQSPTVFRRLWAATAITSLGDGVYLAALPLIGTSLTDDPTVLSLLTATALLPWLLFGLVGGALVDRWDRRATMWLADGIRALVLGCAVLAGALDLLGIPLLLSVAFLLGIGQVLFDTASQAYLPQLLDREPQALQRANARLRGAQTVADGFAGPPLGSALYTLGRTLPLLADAVSFLASALLIRSLPRLPRPARASRGSLWSDIRQGTSYLFGNRLLLGLALRPAVGNVAFMAGEAVLVLYAKDKLGLSTYGYGFLLAAQAVGGLLGTVVAGRVGTLVGTGTALALTAGTEAVAQLAVGLSPGPWWAAAGLVVCGAGMSATMVLGPPIRQTIVPAELMGRVSAASRLFAFGGGPVGALIGGWLAGAVGLRAPFVFGAVLLGAMTLMTATLTSNRRIEAALAEAARRDDHPAAAPGADSLEGSDTSDQPATGTSATDK